MTAPHDDNPLAATLAPGILIGGERRAASGPACDHHDPATGAVLASFALASASDIDAAVASARDARAGWRALPADQRGQVLHRFADLLMANAEELVVLAAYETGSPVSSGGGAVYLSSIWTRYYAGWTDKLDGSVVPAYPVPGFEYVVPEPYGVVGVIVPWNSPLVALAMKAVPALAAGNTVVVKPPELAPATSLRFAELALEAGVPPGVLNVAPGGAEAGDALVRHRHVDKVSFTGGTATARRVMAAAAESVKPLALELGGKSANLVFPDADLPKAIGMAVQLALVTLSGQGCVLPTRLYVHDDVYDEVVEGVAAAADALVLGNPFDPATQLGPVVSAAAQERILGVIADAQRDGAKLLAGGDRGTGELADGYYVQPTVFGEVDQGSALAQGEVFGPVLACLRFEDDDDALAKANDSDFGLGAYLHTRDLARAHRFAAELESGTVHVNGFSGMTPTAPFGGVKSSGFGREGGRAGIEEFVRPKSVFIAT